MYIDQVEIMNFMVCLKTDVAYIMENKSSLFVHKETSVKDVSVSQVQPIIKDMMLKKTDLAKDILYNVKNKK